MEKYLFVALENLKGADYGEARFVRTTLQHISVRNGKVESVSERVEEGIGVRAVVKGSVGFASTNAMLLDEVVKTAKLALTYAKASYEALGKAKPFLSEPRHEGEYITPLETDPFTVPVERKISLLMEVDEILAKDPRIVLRTGDLHFRKVEKIFVNTEGSYLKQTIYLSGGGYTAYALVDGVLAHRSYPAHHGGNHLQAGWEFIEEMDLPAHAERIREEALMFAKADTLKSEMETTLVLGTHQMILQIHESVGHPLELDRAIGYEASYAGTSFARPELLGKLRYGSPLMNIVADATLRRGMGTFGWDDEGVEAQKVPLIREGILVGYLSSRDSAWAIGLERSGGMARASGFNRMPMVRMTNVYLLPGEGSLEDILSEIRDGIYMDLNKSWSIDQRRLNFQFSTEVAYRIRKGKLAEPLRNVIYYGITPEFWGSMYALAGKDEWKLWGLPHCGKGEPGQSMDTGHAASPAAFRNVRVGGSA
ncbi:MAG: TldD/PmbA family protein [Thermotogae bacterium]|nr:TldD/PmbA family protein [Thermotogota bacterium]